MARFVHFLLLATLFGNSGCYDQSTHGDQTVFSFAAWLGPVVILGGLVFVPAGWFLRRVSAKWGFVVMGLAPVLLILVAPAMYSDKVVVDAEHFEARYGIWFAPSTHNIRFDDLREIRHVGVRGNRNRVNYQLECVRKDGSTEVVAIGDLVVNAVPEILRRAEAKQVQILRLAPE
jgi:hypothetical protein